MPGAVAHFHASSAAPEESSKRPIAIPPPKHWPPLGSECVSRAARVTISAGRAPDENWSAGHTVDPPATDRRRHNVPMAPWLASLRQLAPDPRARWNSTIGSVPVSLCESGHMSPGNCSPEKDDCRLGFRRKPRQGKRCPRGRRDPSPSELPGPYRRAFPQRSQPCRWSGVPRRWAGSWPNRSPGLSPGQSG